MPRQPQRTQSESMLSSEVKGYRSSYRQRYECIARGVETKRKARDFWFLRRTVILRVGNFVRVFHGFDLILVF